jgi:mannose-6-phosphate isomerase
VRTTAAPGVSATLLENPVRPYAWGSHTALPELLGVPASGEPQAELWMGAHPGDPSLLMSDPPVSLLDRIRTDPDAALGPAVAGRFGPRLPFLLKVIAAEKVLSLQAHPTSAQAAAGYAEENDQGLPLGAVDRNYRDPFHKPEMLCPLTPFDVLCGFRPVEDTVRLLDQIAAAAGPRPVSPDRSAATLYGAIEALRKRPDSHGLREVVTGLLTKPADRRGPLVKVIVGACQRALAGPVGSGEFAGVLRTVLSLAEAYPGDVGVVIALLMNLIHLQPGEAMFVPAGVLHSYIRGTGVEIMAASDNVLRGGLTPKHVDVPELLRVLELTPGLPPIATGRRVGVAEEVYDAPIAEFRLSRVTMAAPCPVRLAAAGPQILLVTDGEATVSGAGEPVVLPRGRSAWVPAGAAVTLTGNGTVFRATTNLDTD